jgi:hypothetical protein
MTAYGITFVDDGAMMDGHDFAFVAIPDGGWIFYRESTLSPESLEDSWAAYRALLASGDGGDDPTSEAIVEETAQPSLRSHARPFSPDSPTRYAERDRLRAV